MVVHMRVRIRIPGFILRWRACHICMHAHTQEFHTRTHTRTHVPYTQRTLTAPHSFYERASDSNDEEFDAQRR